MQKGIDFEKKCVECAENAPWECPEVMASITISQPVMTIGEIITDGMFQVTLKKEIDFDDCKLLLYGKADVMKFDTIYDIKYTSNYDVGKFSNSVQHLLYMFCSGLEKFEYLISDGENFWKEDYYLSSDEIEKRLFEKLHSFLSWIRESKKHWEIFNEKWLAM